jgi:hypothetical protein
MSFKNILVLTACVALLTSHSAIALDLPSSVKTYLQTKHLLDESGRPLPDCNATLTGSGNVFVQYVLSNWSAMLDNLAAIAPAPQQQKLVIRAIEYLPPRDYLKALNKLCDLNAAGVVKSETLEFAVKARSPENGLLSKNYQDTQVIQLVQRLQALFPKDSKIQGLLGDILSGKQKAVDQKKADDEDVTAPVTLPAQ